MSVERRRRLLIVDDSDDLASALELSLGDHPAIEVVGRASNAEGLVGLVRSKGAEVVLLDLTMPGIDPLDALRELRAAGVPVRVIAFSGRDDGETVAAAERAGADRFLRKCVDPEAIAAAVRSVVE
ncbi:MAG TPA: response regulator transcription factor [Phycisphaerales bacterium]|nr:response regulator transcription factor [Phycisphaerales bacterium]HMP37367.1 response regulator transcription factor [Phycisphaerales bacterium]